MASKKCGTAFLERVEENGGLLKNRKPNHEILPTDEETSKTIETTNKSRRECKIFTWFKNVSGIIHNNKRKQDNTQRFQLFSFIF